jgi:UDP-glucose:glycoprotein glucosyltransferase
MDLPSSWLARPHESEHDLDNIHLSSLTEAEYADGVKAIFRLDHLVIEGHARESRETPPRGLQLQLSNLDGSIVADTQVVANLGYLQFKAGPGVFQLGIREGRGRQMYEMESVGNEGWNSPTVAETGVDVTVTNFEGLTIYPRFRKRPGQEEADVLDDSAEQKEGSVLSDFWSKLVFIFLFPSVYFC